MDKFIEQQCRIYPLSEETIQILLGELEEMSFPKGVCAFREGQREPYIWFVKEGLIRAYVEREGKDVTLWFVSDGEMINSVYRDCAAYNVEMMEDSVLLRINAKRLKSLCEHSLDLCNWGFKLMDYYLCEYENYFINDSWSDARGQYDALLRSNPELFQRVPLKHIASYLQITPQSLSRIRSSQK